MGKKTTHEKMESIMKPSGMTKMAGTSKKKKKSC